MTRFLAYLISIGLLSALSAFPHATLADGPEEALQDDTGDDSAAANTKKSKKKVIDDEDRPVDVQGRITMLEYDKDDIYTIACKVGYQTNIEFSPHEEVETISVGDRSFWQLIPSGNRLFIRPMQENVATNMTLITNRRSYQFDLKSVGPRDSRVMYVARFVYPEDEARKARAAASTESYMNLPPAWTAPAPATVPAAPIPPAPQTVTLTPLSEEAPIVIPAPSKRNYRYTYSGPDYNAPYEVFDNGTVTFIRYQDPTRLAPLVAKIDAQGRETPLRVTRVADYYVVDTVAPQLAVTADGMKVSLFNETLASAP